MPSRSRAPSPGEKLGRYHVLDRIGWGGMGVVYKAEDSKLRRDVALKFLPRELAKARDALARFQREARAASSINHPHICTTYDIDEHDVILQKQWVYPLLKGTGQQRPPSDFRQH